MTGFKLILFSLISGDLYNDIEKSIKNLKLKYMKVHLLKYFIA